MPVRFLDINAQNRSIESELRAELDVVINSGQFILGPAVERFERGFAEYIGARHCVGLNNGTSALHMAMIASGIGPGDEVITTPHTWVSTSWAISYVGATPVYADIDRETYTLHPDLVEAAITPRTRAILPVHLYGQAAAIVQLRSVADRYGLVLIEDAAQAHGAVFDGQRLGSFGDVGCFSFYPGKNLGAFGEAGAIVTDSAEIATRIHCLRDHAQQGRHDHAELGFNTRMEGIQAAVLSVKLKRLDRWNELRRRNAAIYDRLLSGIDELQLPGCPRPEAHVWHLYVVLVNGTDRDQLREALASAGIATAVHYPKPVPFQPAYQHLGYQPGDFPVAEDVAARCMSLPMYPELSEEDICTVADAARRCFVKQNAAGHSFA